MPDSVTVSSIIEAPAFRLYTMVSDVTRMREWSPENVKCRWVGDADGPAVGAEFVGVNAYHKRRWRTFCRVVAADPGREFAFEVTGERRLKVSLWRYEFRPVGGGTEVIESWTDRRGWFLKVFGRLVLGIRSRPEHNRAGMVMTLAALKVAAEGADAAV